jgi:hypothetical protein
MTGIHRHVSQSDLFKDTQPVGYTIQWPINLGGSTATVPTENSLLNWGANTLSFWIYIGSFAPSEQNIYQAFRWHNLNIAYSQSTTTLVIQEMAWTDIEPNAWYSIIFQNSNSGANTICRVNDQLPDHRLTLDDSENSPPYIKWQYHQDDPQDSPTTYSPSALNQGIGNFTRPHRNEWRTPETPGIYERVWEHPQIALIRYSTSFLDMSHKHKHGARWTAYNQHNQPGRDIDRIWTEPLRARPTRTQGTTTVYNTETQQNITVTTHSYNWSGGFSIPASIVDPLADSDTNTPVYESLGLKISTRWTPTDQRLLDSFVYPPTA